MQTDSIVFVSYSHDDDAHVGRVRALVDRLIEDGLDVRFDLYAPPSPPQGWPLWCEEQIDAATFVLVVATQTYQKRYNQKEPLGVGRGATWEAHIIRQKLYDNQSRNNKYLPVVFSIADGSFIPTALNSATRYTLTTDEGYKQLFRHLTDQPEFVPPMRGTVRVLPPVVSPQAAESNPPTTTPPPLATPSTLFDTELTSAFTHTVNGNPQRTIDLLGAIREYRWKELSNFERYKVLANLGSAWLAMNDTQQAATLYTQAYSLNPESERAQELLAHAAVMQGQKARALELADVLCAKYPHRGVGHAIKVKCAPDGVPIDVLEASVPEPLRNDPEVCIALHNRASDAGEYASAERFARVLHELAPKDPTYAGMLGAAIANQVLAVVSEARSFEPVVRYRGRVEAAVALFDSVLKAPSTQVTESLRRVISRNRGIARRLLGDIEGSLADSKAAHEADPGDSELALAYTLALEGVGQPDEAIEVMRRVYRSKPSPRTTLMLAHLLAARNATGDTAMAADALFSSVRSASELAEEFRNEWYELAIALLVKNDRAHHADQVFALAQLERVDPVTLHLLESERHSSDKLVQARALDAALAAASSETERGRLRRLAQHLSKADRHSDALRIYRAFVPSDQLTSDSRLMALAALKGGDDAFLLEFLEGLRNRTVIDAGMLELELDLATRYNDPRRAIAVIQAGKAAFPSDYSWTVNLAIVAMETGRDELIPRFDDLPPPAAVSSSLGHGIVRVLVGRISRARAVEYAYPLYRRHPNDPEAVAALITAVLMPGPINDLQIPTAAVNDAVVAYTTDGGNNEPSFAVLESEIDPPPDAERDEYGVHHQMYKAVYGKQVGETFEEPASFGPRRSATIVAITHKAVHRANQLAQSWRRRFPHIPFIEEYRVGDVNEADADPKKLLGEAYAVLEAHGQRVDKLNALYKESPVPVQVIARKASRSVLLTVAHFAQQTPIGIRCAEGTITEKADVSAALRSVAPTSGVVLEPTAVATLLLIGQESVLAQCPFPLIVTESVLQELRGGTLNQSCASDDEGPLVVGVHEGELTTTVYSRAAIISWNERILKLVDDLRQRCEVVGGADVAALPREHRERFGKWFPPSTLDSVAVAKRRSSVLWTDDLVTAAMVRQEWRQRTAHTLAVAERLSELGLVDDRAMARIGVNLHRWNYHFIGVSAGMVIEALGDAKWDLREPLPRKLLGGLAPKAMTVNQLVPVLSAVFHNVWRHAPTRMQSEEVSAFILKVMEERSDATELGRHVLERVNILFGLDVVGAQLFGEQLRSWIRGRDMDGGLVIRP